MNEGIAVSGDTVRLSVRRGEQTIELRETLGPPSFPRLAGQTPRSSGFTHVLSVQTNVLTETCGGPVIDREGRTLGIVLAWREGNWALVLPADIARTLAAEPN